ncbi:MAG: phage terminase large subunit [Alphaproteobacteria bacterium]|nr:phage terminase large subunit [Alphaproteobacteria bacterium]
MQHHIHHIAAAGRLRGGKRNIKNNIRFALFLAVWNRREGLSTPKVHFKIARFLESQWRRDAPRILLMAFRACGKSTLMGLFCAWILMGNPNLRILVISADHALARKMVRNVKRIIEKHPMTRHLTPHDTTDSEWAGDRFTVVREQELRDPSMLARGITSNLTGTRADVIICDDVEVPRTSGNAHKRHDLREKLAELNYILNPDGAQIYIGTPHCFHTIYADEPRSELGEDVPFLDRFARMKVPIMDEAGMSVWPERFGARRIKEMQKSVGPAHFKSQMMCEPVQINEGYLRTNLLQIYDEEMEAIWSGKQPLVTIGGRKITHVSAWWDPAFGGRKGDGSVVAVVYRDSSGAFLLHHLAQITVDEHDAVDEATQQCRQVTRIIEHHFLPQIMIETNGIGGFLPKILMREIRDAGLMCHVNTQTSHIPKEQRILQAFDAPLAARAIHVHRSVLKTPFVAEMEDWQPRSMGGNAESGAGGGYWRHDDCLDATAGAILGQFLPVRKVTRWEKF